MANTSSRALALLSLLQTHRYWPGDELADRLGVSLRTVRRDVDRLRELGYPVEAQRGVDGGYQLAPGASLPPLVLDDEEAVALAIALMNAAQSSVEGVAEASVRALAKVVQVLPKRLQRRVDVVRGATDRGVFAVDPDQVVDSRVLTVAAQACRDSVRLYFRYVTGDGASSGRRVDPHRLVSLGRRWYLVAWDLERHDWRVFRLDRVSRPELGATRFAPRRLPGGVAASAYVRSRLGGVEPPQPVIAVVDAPADVVRGRIGNWAVVTADGPSRCSVRVRSDSYDWAVAALGLTGATFRAVEPAAFVAQVRAWRDRLVAAVSD